MQYNFRGTYDIAQDYNKLDVVVHQTSPDASKYFYLCLTSHTKESPQSPLQKQDTIYWGWLNGNSNFPESIDDFLYRSTITATDLINYARYEELFKKPSLTPVEQDEMSTLQNKLRVYMYQAEDFNKLQSAVQNMQFFLKNEVEGYITQKQIEFQNEINKFNDKGSYNPLTQYYTKNFVHHNQEVYIALKNNLGITPSDDGVNWRKLSVKGDKGDKGNDGVNLVYQKTFNPTINYVVNDVVTYNGSAYACILNTPIGKYPDGIDGATYWTLFVSGGGGIGDLNSLTTVNKDNLVNAVNEVNSDLEEHKGNNSSHVPHLGTTTNVDNTYTVNSSLVVNDGDKFSVKFNAVSTGTSTLNISSDGTARALKKPDGNDFKPKAGIYSFIRDGLNFQLLGEGGEYGTAKAPQVLEGYTVGTDDGLVNGTIPTLGTVTAIAQDVSGTTIRLRPPAGYNTGTASTLITATDADFVAGNIKSGIDIFGLVGTYTSDANAVAGDILSGKTAYVNGNKITGTIPSKGAQTFTPTTANQTIASGQYLSGTQTIAGDANLIASNIISGKNIFGIAGTGMTPSVKSIQRGQATYTGATTTIDVPISSIDLTKTIVIANAFMPASNQSALRIPLLAQITASNNLRFTRASDSTIAVTVIIDWQIIEFNNVKSLQTGVFNYTGTSYAEQSLGISSVNMGKALVFATFNHKYSDSYYGAGFNICYLKDSTTLGVKCNGSVSNGGIDVAYQVIEFN